MTRTRYKIYETTHPYFLTCTVVGWTPIFTRPETVQIIIDSWKYLQANRVFSIYGFIILENHLHLIASSENLSEDISSFKSFTARKIIELLEARNIEVLLRQLRYQKARHKEDRTYQLWQEGSHPQLIENDAIMWQKLEYIHNNPVERGYVDDPLHWRYSSARNYAGQQGLVTVRMDWR
jgi:REP element-mobilizing transposase RayT